MNGRKMGTNLKFIKFLGCENFKNKIIFIFGILIFFSVEKVFAFYNKVNNRFFLLLLIKN